MKDILNFRAWFDGRFIYKSLCDSNVYTEDNKCICPANTLPDLPWEQCTGLKDKNGKLIYEGDIVQDVEDPLYVSVVMWDEIDLRWKTKGRGYEIVGSVYPENHIVIGNIHENKELLNEMR